MQRVLRSVVLTLIDKAFRFRDESPGSVTRTLIDPFRQPYRFDKPNELLYCQGHGSSDECLSEKSFAAVGLQEESA